MCIKCLCFIGLKKRMIIFHTFYFYSTLLFPFCCFQHTVVSKMVCLLSGSVKSLPQKCMMGSDLSNAPVSSYWLTAQCILKEMSNSGVKFT